MDLWPASAGDGDGTPLHDRSGESSAWLEAPGVSVMVSLTDLARPRADEILHAYGLGSGDVARWLHGWPEGDRLTSQARTAAWAVGTLADTGACGIETPGGTPALVALQPESVSANLHWRLQVARPGAPFTPAQASELCAQLRAWQARFNAPPTPGSIRMVVGADGRVVHVDPSGQMLLASGGIDPAALARELERVRAQRWPGDDGPGAHDLAVDVAGEPWWAVVDRRRAVRLPGAEHAFIELRPLEEGELPAVGLLPDERIARALGYLHDHYRRCPRLAEVARYAHVSPFHFHRLFTRLVGVSPKQYLQMKQLQSARWRLRAHRAPIGRIAREAGFSSHGHFTSTFRRLVGLSPTSYRNRAWE